MAMHLGLSRSRRTRTGWRVACAAAVLAMTATLLGAPAANAEVQHPRQAWMRNATAGLFLHWGMFTTPIHLDCAQWEHDVTAGGWTPNYWIDEAGKLGASYVVLTTFHSRLGYARPWPSKIPGSCATQRDFLGELIEAGKAKDIRVLLYMTDDPQWHMEQGIETLDSAAYSAYKGEQVDLRTRPGFGKYSYDLFFEVMANYPDLAGFWIDNDNEYWEQNHLYEQIRQIQPSWLLSNNNEDTPIMDTVSNEQKTGMTPSYDYPAAAWMPMPRLVEADYKLPTVGQWWFDGNDSAVDLRLSTGRYITNAGSSMKSLMAETAMVNGKFPPQQEAFNNFMAGWVPPIRESLQGTEGGGYMYGGMQPGFWNDGAHGVITVKPGARTQYVHVVTRPRTDMVRLRDNGYLVTSVTDLRTGQPMRFDQSVLKASASSARAGQPASNLVDGSYETFWDSGAQLPVSVTLDLGKPRVATHLALHQREWSPTYARETFGRPEDSARIKDYQVSVSVDGITWRQVRAGAVRTARGVQFIDIGLQLARYIKLDVLNTWAGPQAPRFFHELQIDEINVGYGYPAAAGSPVPLEAESVDTGRTGRTHLQLCLACSGSYQVVGLGGGAGNSVMYRNVEVAADGTYRLALDRTAVGPLPPASYVPKTTLRVLPHGIQWVGAGQQSITISASLRLDVDDAIDQVQLAPVVPAGWTMTGSPLTAASMRLGQTLSGSWTLTSPPGQDVTAATIPVTASFQLLGRPLTASSPVQMRLRPADRVFMREAEDSQNQLGSAGLTGCGRCSGGEKVRNIGGAPDAFVVFPNVTVDKAGEYTLFIDYTVNGDRSFFVSVNGGTPVEAPVSGLGNATPQTTTVRVTLQAGSNTIKIFNDNAAAPDLDRLSLG